MVRKHFTFYSRRQCTVKWWKEEEDKERNDNVTEYMIFFKMTTDIFMMMLKIINLSKDEKNREQGQK